VREKKVAVRYAAATLGSIKDVGEMETVGGDLDAFAKTCADNAELRKILIHPGIPLESKRRIVAQTAVKLNLSAKAKKTLDVVLRRGRIDVASDIAESYGLMLDEKLGRQKVRVTSAFPLSPADSEGLEKAFSALTGKKAKLELTVDKSLIGGIVASVGSKVYDGSVSNQIKRLKVKLEQEA
jgi:F-type H+-transporting ATPase subunit delta